MRFRNIAPLAVALSLALTGALDAPPSAAQGAPSIRVGLRVGSAALSAVTLGPAVAGGGVVYAGDGASATLSGQSYVRDLGFRDLVATTPDLQAGQADVASLGAGGRAGYLEETPLGTYDVFAGPFASAAAAQSAAPAVGAQAVYGPYGALIGGLASLTAAQALAGPYWQSGVPAYPMLLAGGGWGLLVGQYPTAAAADQEVAAVQAASPGALAYAPSGSELMVQLPSGAVALLAQSQQVLSASGQGVLTVQGKAYRGTLTFALTGARVQVVDTLPLEEYLYGVVPAEMPASWAQAALEAQAIASRTYALYAIQHAAAGSLFDVYASTQSQAYGGYAAEQPSTSAAVDATEGMVMTYDGQVIDAVFAADSGGATENSENVWSAALPYLRGVKELPGYKPTTWTVTLSAADIANLVLTWSGTNIGSLEQMALMGQSATFSGRPLSVLFVGSAGQYTVEKDSIRGLLGLPSTLFTEATDAQVTVEGAGVTQDLPSLVGSFAQGAEGASAPLPASVSAEGAGGLSATYPLTASTYTLAGRGNGHGVGMSQDGAEYMATQGLDAQEILSHYYTGVSFTPDN